MLPRRLISHAQGYLALGLAAEAEAALNRLVGPDAARPEVAALRLAALQGQEKWPEVRALAATLVQASPEDAGLWITWAYATRRAESLDAAELILRDAEQLHPADATIQFNLGCYACQRGDLALARSRVDRAIALDRTYADLAATDPDLAALRT
ncbi:MAG: hypothetical protein JNL92_19145 [Opitutaceae bacterium]|nr:hypothetical protein [Opitutaceae bacterium]